MPAPRPASATGPTPASAYIRERKLLRAYDALLRSCDLDGLIAACFGVNLSPSKAAAADERLQYAMPELLLKLTPDQQEPFAEWLLGESPDLPRAVRELVRLENALHRPALPHTKEDDWRVKSASLGKCRAPLAGDALRRHLLSQAAKAPKLGPPLELVPFVPVRRPVLRTKKRGRRKPLVVLRGQYSLWPSVSGGVGVAVGL